MPDRASSRNPRIATLALLLACTAGPAFIGMRMAAVPKP